MSRQTPVIEYPALELHDTSAIPLYRQLYERIREAILSGQLQAGTRLPSTRSLAGQLSVSRNTVFQAYEQLLAEGYIVGKVGHGTRVANVLPENFLYASSSVLQTKQPISTADSVELSQQGKLLASASHMPTYTHKAGKKPRVYSFHSGIPDLEEFPYELWTQLITRHARESLHAVANYQDPAGYRPLREAIASYLGVARGVRCVPDQVLITSGSQGAFDLAVRMLLNPGDSVWMENPGYPGARGTLAGIGATIIPVPVDKEGLDIEAGKALAPHARMAFVTPSHQFPIGVTMSLSRRLALLEWATRINAWILEDDYDSEYRFSGRPLAALQGLDQTGRVIYTGTFSKVLFPSLRLGYMVVPSTLVKDFIHARRFINTYAPVLEQLALTDFMTEGHFTRHIRKMRLLYAKRRAALVQAIEQYLPILEIHSPEAGLHLISWLPEGVDDMVVARQAARYGVEITPLSFFSMEPLRRGGLMIGYGAISEEQMQAGVRLLQQVLYTVLEP